jgi:cell division septation protein DedD
LKSLFIIRGREDFVKPILEWPRMKSRKPEDNTEEQLSLELENLYKEIERPDKIDRMDKVERGEGGKEPDLRPAYELFKVEPDASHEELKEAYEELASAWNPKRFSDHPEWKEKAEKKLEIINKAYEMILSARIREIRKKKRSIQLGEIEKDIDPEYAANVDESEDYQKEDRPRRFGVKQALIFAMIPVFLLFSWFVVSPLFENSIENTPDKKAVGEKSPPLARPIQQIPVPESKPDAKPETLPEPRPEVKTEPASAPKAGVKPETRPEIKREPAAQPPKAAAAAPAPKPAAKAIEKKPAAPALKTVPDARQAPKAPPKAETAKKDPSPAAMPFSIQVGAVKDRGKGMELLGKVRKDGLSGSLVTTTLPGGEKGYRVLVGGFQTREEAVAYIESKGLRQKYPGSFIQKNKP